MFNQTSLLPGSTSAAAFTTFPATTPSTTPAPVTTTTPPTTTPTATTGQQGAVTGKFLPMSNPMLQQGLTLLNNLEPESQTYQSLVHRLHGVAAQGSSPASDSHAINHALMQGNATGVRGTMASLSSIASNLNDPSTLQSVAARWEGLSSIAENFDLAANNFGFAFGLQKEFNQDLQAVTNPQAKALLGQLWGERGTGRDLNQATQNRQVFDTLSTLRNQLPPDQQAAIDKAQRSGSTTFYQARALETLNTLANLPTEASRFGSALVNRYNGLHQAIAQLREGRPPITPQSVGLA